MAVMLLLRPRIGKEHIDRAHSMRRQQIPKRVERLKPQNMGVRDLKSAALLIKRMDAAQHTFNTEEIPVRMRFGAARQESSLTTANLHLQRTGSVKSQR